MKSKQKWATCEDCKRPMKPGTRCTITHYQLKGGKVVRRRPHDQSDLNCHDCNTPPGGMHHPGCDAEECPVCGGQAIGCECLRP